MSNYCILHSLDISECKINGRGGISIFSAIYRQMSLKHLRMKRNQLSLHGQSTNYSSNTFCHTLETRFPPQLVSINLEQCHLGNNECQAIASNIRHGIKLANLTLRNNPISEGGMTDLFNSLAHQLCNVKSLDISQTNLDDYSAHAIVRCLTNNNTLQKMNISHTLISGCSKQIAAAI